MPTLPPLPTTTSRSPLFAVAVTVLVCFALLALVLEGSAISSVNTHLRAWGGDDDAITSARAAAGVVAAAVAQHNASVVRDSNAEWVMQTSPNATVPPSDLLHLSLLQAACLKHKNSGIPWHFGTPGENQESERMNEALLFNKDDVDIVDRLRECPDVDVYLPEGLRGHGYCEDAVAYAKCTYMSFFYRGVSTASDSNVRAHACGSQISTRACCRAGSLTRRSSTPSTSAQSCTTTCVHTRP